MNKKFLTIGAASFAATVALAGCAAAPGAGSTSTPGSTSSAGMDHGTPAASEYTAPASSAPAAAAHNAADTMFAQSMIPHHAQAIEMSGIVLAKKNVPAAVRSLAERIKAAQAPEIADMTGWLKSWNESVPNTGMSMGGHDMGGSGSGMGGMMSEADLNKLKAAQGTEAARLFLTQMIAHHEGAVTMAKAERADGANPGAIKLSQGIEASQQAEIQEMKKLLAEL